MTEQDLTPNLRGLLAFIEAHASREIPDTGSFDPFGILVKRVGNARSMVFLETVEGSADALKGMPGNQMQRRIEDLIRRHRNDSSIESAALAIDARTRSAEGGKEGDAVVAWLDDRGKQCARVVMFYKITGGKLRVTSRVVESRKSLFLFPIHT